MKTLSSLFAALAILTLVACGGGSSEAASQGDPEPAPVDDTVSADPSTAGGEADPAADPAMGDEPAAESCYVESVDETTGCWASADEACTAVCGAPCTCTEATANNTCGC